MREKLDIFHVVPHRTPIPKFYLKNVLGPAPGGNVFIDFFKAKNEEKLNLILNFPLSKSKTILPILGA